MLNRLAFRNVKRSIKDYVIYLITVILAFSLIFSFNLISNSKDILELSDMMDYFKYATMIVSVIIIFVVGWLINYTTKFMFQKRSKEFGTYMILGIEKKKISKMFVIENLLLGIIAFIVSLFIGIVFSNIMSAIIMKIFEFPYEVSMTISLPAILLSLLYFVIIYTFVLIVSTRRIKKMKIYDLLYYEKQNEKKPLNKKIHRNILFVISLIMGIISLILFGNEFKTVGREPSMSIIFICLILVIISIYGISYSLSDFLLNYVLKRNKVKYNKDNLFVIRQFTSKVKTMSFTLGTLSLLIALTFISLNISNMFNGIFKQQIDYENAYDISIETDKKDFPKFIKYIEAECGIKEKYTFDIYKDSKNNIYNKMSEEDQGWKPFDPIVKLSDYNKILAMKGDSSVTLNDDEYILHVGRTEKKSLDKINTEYLKLSNGTILKQKAFIDEGYTVAWSLGSGYILIVPDKIAEKLEVADSHLIINTVKKTTEDLHKELVKMTDQDFCEENEEGYQTCYELANILTRGYTEANNRTMTTILSFVLLYLAFIFTAVVGTILAIQSLSDSTKYKYRYSILKKLGVQDKLLYKTIKKQLLLFFIFPIIYPLIISISTITSMNVMFKSFLETDTQFITYLITGTCLFLAIYLIYFIATYFNFKNNIKETCQ